ncbi:WD40/YVTN repeat-like-containing domain [Cinara cedri]|uniref:WD40/YVTN repeat-like-containing domain n=1 Tax=Cinara cedri TaxID=506608 RepID=A0A5E4M5N4_9HEMI|nr:WD40/YVTN repeat-like-containing domain [Cinara cedri]
MDPDQQPQPDKKHLLLQQQRSSQQIQRQQQQLLETQSQQNQHALQTQQLLKIQPQTQQHQQKELLKTQSQSQQRQQLLQTQQLQCQQNQQLLQTQQLKQQYQLLQTQSQSQQNKQPLQTPQQQQILIQPLSVKRQQQSNTQHQLLQSQQQSQPLQQFSQTQQQQIQPLQSQLQSQQPLQTQQQPQQLLWRKQASLQQRILQQEHLKQQHMLLDRQKMQEQTLRELLQLEDDNNDKDNTKGERFHAKQKRPQLLQQQQELHLQQQQRQHKEQQQQLLVLQQTQSVQQLQQQSQFLQTTQPQQSPDESQIVNQPGTVHKSQLEKTQAVIQKPQQVQHAQSIIQPSTIQQSQFVQQPQIVQNPHIQTPLQQQHQYVNVSTQQQLKKQPPITTQQLQDQLTQLMKNKNYAQRIVVLNGSPNQQQRVIGTTNTGGQQQMQCVVVAGTSQQQSQQLQRVKVTTASQQQQQPMQRMVVASSGQQQPQQLQHVAAVGQIQKQQLQQIQHSVPSTSHQQSQQMQSVVTTAQSPQQMQRVLVTSTSGQQQQKQAQQLQPTQRIVIGQLKSSQQTQQLQSTPQRSLVLNQQQQRVLIAGQQQLLKLPQHKQQSPQQLLLQPQSTQQLLQPQKRVSSANQQQQHDVQQPQQQVKQQNSQNIIIKPQLTQNLLQPQQRVNSTKQQQQREVVQQPQQMKQQHSQKILLQPQLAQQLLQSKSQQSLNFTQQQEGIQQIPQQIKQQEGIQQIPQQIKQQEGIQQIPQQIKQQIPQHVVIAQQQKQQINVKSLDQNLVTLLNVKPSHQQIQQLPTKQPQKQLLQQQLNNEPLHQRSEVIFDTLQLPIQPEPEISEQSLLLQNSQREKLLECLLQQQRQQHHKNREKKLKERLNEQLQHKQNLQEQLLLAEHHTLPQQQQELQKELKFKSQVSSENRFSFVIGGNPKITQQDDEETSITTNNEQQYQCSDIEDHETSDEDNFKLFSSSSDEDEEDDAVCKQRYLFREAYRLVQERYNALSVALGPNFRMYYDDILRNWMNGRLSHSEFDCEIRKVLYVSWMLPTIIGNSDSNSISASLITTNIPSTITFTSSTSSFITSTTKTASVRKDRRVTTSKETSTFKEKPPQTTSKRKSKANASPRAKKVMKEKEIIIDEDKKIEEISSVLIERMTLHNAFVSSLIALLPHNHLRLERKTTTASDVSETGYPLRLYTYADVPQVRLSSHHWYPDEPGSLPRWYWPDRLPFSPLLMETTDKTQLSKDCYRELEQIEAADAAVEAVLLRPPSHTLLPSLLSSSKNTEAARTAQLERSTANVTKKLKWQRKQDNKRLAVQINMRENHTQLLREIKARGRELDGQESWLIERLRQLQQRISDQRQQVLTQFEIRKQMLQVRVYRYINRPCQELREDKEKGQQLLTKANLTTNNDDEMDVDDVIDIDDEMDLDHEEETLSKKNSEKQRTKIGTSPMKIANKFWRPQSTALMIRLMRDRQRFQACHKLLQRVREERLQTSQNIDRVQKLQHLYCPCGISDNRPCQYRKQMRRFRQKLRCRELEAIEVAIYRELAEKVAEREKTEAENSKKLVVDKIETENLETEKINTVNKKIALPNKKKDKVVKKKSYVTTRSKNKLSAAKSKTNDDALKNIQFKNTTKTVDNLTNVATGVSETPNIVNPVLGVKTHDVEVDMICKQSPQSLGGLGGMRRSMSRLKDQRSAVDVAVAAACAAQKALEASKQKRNQQKKSAADTNNDRLASELMPPPPPPPPKTSAIPKKPTVGARYLMQQRLLLDRRQQLERLRREEAERQQKTYGCRLQENEYIIKERNDQIEEIGHLGQQMKLHSFYYDSSGDYYSSDDESFGEFLPEPLFPPLLHDLRMDQLLRPARYVPSAAILPPIVQESILKTSSLASKNTNVETMANDYKHKLRQQHRYSENKLIQKINEPLKENLSKRGSLAAKISTVRPPLFKSSVIIEEIEELPIEKKKQNEIQTNKDDNQLMSVTNKMEISTSKLSTIQQQKKAKEISLINKHNQDLQANTKQYSIESEQTQIDVKQTNKKKTTTKRKRKRICGRRKQRKKKPVTTILIEDEELPPEKTDSTTVKDMKKYQSLKCKRPCRTQLDKVPVIDLCIDEDKEIVDPLVNSTRKIPIIDLRIDRDTEIVDGLDYSIRKIKEIEFISTSTEDSDLPKLDQNHSEFQVKLVTRKSEVLNSNSDQLSPEYREILKLIVQYHKSLKFFPPMQRLLKLLLMQHKLPRFPPSRAEEKERFMLELLSDSLSQIKQQQIEEIKQSTVVENLLSGCITHTCGLYRKCVQQNWRNLWPLYDNKSSNPINDKKRMCLTGILINNYYGCGKEITHKLLQLNKLREEIEYYELNNNKTNPSKLPENQNILDQQPNSFKEQDQPSQKEKLNQQIQLDQYEQIKQNNQPKQQIKNISQHLVLNKIDVSLKPCYDFSPLRKQLLINKMNYKNRKAVVNLKRTNIQIAFNRDGISNLSYYDTLSPLRKRYVGSNFWWSWECKQRWVSPLATVDMNVRKIPIIKERIADLKQLTIPKTGSVTQMFVNKGIKLLKSVEVKYKKFVMDHILNSVRTNNEKAWQIMHLKKYTELRIKSKKLWDDLIVNEEKQLKLLWETLKQKQLLLPLTSQDEHKEPCSKQKVNQELQKQQRALLSVRQNQDYEYFGLTEFSIGKSRYLIENSYINYPKPIWINGQKAGNIYKSSELIIANSQLDITEKWMQFNKINKECRMHFKKNLHEVNNLRSKLEKFTRTLFNRFKEIQNSGMYQEIPCFDAAIKLHENVPQTRVDQLKVLLQLNQDVLYLKNNPNQSHRPILKAKFSISDNLKQLFELRDNLNDIKSQRKTQIQQHISTMHSIKLDLQNKPAKWILRKLALLMHNQRFVLQRQLNRFDVQNPDNILNQRNMSETLTTHIQPSLTLISQENQASGQRSLHYSKILLTPLQSSTLKLPSPTFSVILSEEQPDGPKQIVATIPILNTEQQEPLKIDKELILKKRFNLLMDKLKPLMELWQLSFKFPGNWLHQQLDDIEQTMASTLTTTTSLWSWKQIKRICDYLKWRQKRVNKLVNEILLVMNQEHMAISPNTVSRKAYSVSLELPKLLMSNAQPSTHSVLLKLPQPLAPHQQSLTYPALLKLQIPPSSEQNSLTYSTLLKLPIPLKENHQLNSNSLQPESASKRRLTSPSPLISSKRFKTSDSESETTQMDVQMSEESPLVENTDGKTTIIEQDLIGGVHATYYKLPTQLTVNVNEPTKVIDVDDKSIKTLPIVGKPFRVAFIECLPSMTISKDMPIKLVSDDAKSVLKKSVDIAVSGNLRDIMSQLVASASEMAQQETSLDSVDCSPIKTTVPIEELKTDNLMEKSEANDIKTKNTTNLNKIVDISNIQRQSIPVKYETVRRYRRLIRTRTVDIHGPDIPSFHDHGFAYGTTERAVHGRFIATIMSMKIAQSIASYIPPNRLQMPYACSVLKQSKYVHDGVTNECNTNNDNCTVADSTSLQISNLIDGLEKATEYSTNSGCHNGHLSSGCARTSGAELIAIVKRLKSTVSTLQTRDASSAESKVPIVIPSQSVGQSRKKVTETVSVVTKPMVATIKPPPKNTVLDSLNTISTNNSNTNRSVIDKRPASVAFTETSSTLASSPPITELCKKSKSTMEVNSVCENKQKPAVGLNKRSAKVTFSSAVSPTSTTSLSDTVSMSSPSIRSLKRSKSTEITANTSTKSTPMAVAELQSNDKIRSALESVIVSSTKKDELNKLSTVKLLTPAIRSTKRSKSAIITASTSTKVDEGDDLNRSEQVNQSAQDTEIIKHVSSLTTVDSSPLVVEPLKRLKSAEAMTTTKLTPKPELPTSSLDVAHKPESMATSVKLDSICESMTSNDSSNNLKIDDDDNTINVKTTTITEEETRTVTVNQTRCSLVPAPMDVTAESCTLVVSACEQFVRQMLMERMLKTGRGAGTLELRRRKAFEAAMAVDDDIRPTSENCWTKTIAATTAFSAPVTVENAQANGSDPLVSEQSLPYVIADKNSKQSTIMTVKTVVETHTTTITTTTTTKINKSESQAATKTVPATKTISSPTVLRARSPTWVSGAAVQETKRRLPKTKMTLPSKLPSGTSARTIPMITMVVSSDDEDFEPTKTATTKPINKNTSTMHLSSKPEINGQNTPSDSMTTVEVSKIVPISIPENTVPVADAVNVSAGHRGFFVERGRPLVRPSFHRRQKFGTLAATCSMAAAKVTAENHATHRYFNDGNNGNKDNGCYSYLGDPTCLPPVSRLNDFLVEDYDSECPPVVASKSNEVNSSVAFQRHQVMLEMAKQQEKRKELEREMVLRVQKHQKQPPDSPLEYYEKFLQLQYGTDEQMTSSTLCRPLNCDAGQNYLNWND